MRGASMRASLALALRVLRAIILMTAVPALAQTIGSDATVKLPAG